MSSSKVKLEIVLSPNPIFLYPNSSNESPEIHGSDVESSSTAIHNQTVVHGSVRVSADEPMVVGKMSVVWEVQARRKSLMPFRRDWSVPEVVKRLMVEIGEVGMMLERGTTT